MSNLTSAPFIAPFRLLSSQPNASLDPASSADLPAKHAAKNVLKPMRPYPSGSIDRKTSNSTAEAVEVELGSEVDVGSEVEVEGGSVVEVSSVVDAGSEVEVGPDVEVGTKLELGSVFDVVVESKFDLELGSEVKVEAGSEVEAGSAFEVEVGSVELLLVLSGPPSPMAPAVTSPLTVTWPLLLSAALLSGVAGDGSGGGGIRTSPCKKRQQTTDDTKTGDRRRDDRDEKINKPRGIPSECCLRLSV